MRRGDIHSVDLDPVRGSEANKRRPPVIVSNDAANATAGRLGRGVMTASGSAVFRWPQRRGRRRSRSTTR